MSKSNVVTLAPTNEINSLTLLVFLDSKTYLRLVKYANKTPAIQEIILQLVALRHYQD